MQLEPMPESDGYRCWLSDSEQAQLLEHLKETPERQLAVRAMLHGLRSDELSWVRTGEIRELDAEQEGYKLRIRDGKTGYREAPVSRELVQQMRMYKNATSTRKNKPLVTASKRSIRRWVSKASNELADATGDDDWREVSPHDLRRTWATSTYYALDSVHAVDIIMRWGGWSDRDTFTNNYLGRETDSLAVEMMEQSGLR
jgi:integrase